MMNNNIFDMASKVVFGGKYIANGTYGEYKLMKINHFYTLLHKGDVILEVMDEEIQVERAKTKHEQKAIYTVKVVLGLAE